MASVLEGIRVLDLSWGVAGPVAGMLLADHGADVIKVEPPGGDPLRGNPGYDVWLRGRRSVGLDLTAARPAETGSWTLIDGADVVLESFSAGTPARLGIGGDDLLAAQPRTGALLDHRLRPPPVAIGTGPATTLWSRPGSASCTSSAAISAAPSRHARRRAVPGRSGDPRGDGAGLAAQRTHLHLHPVAEHGEPLSWRPTGISAALYARLRTGRGQHVETSLLQAALSAPRRSGCASSTRTATGFRSWIYDQRATKGFFQCSDGRWVQQWVPNPQFVLASADGDTLALRRGVDRVRDDPERIPPDPENIVVLAYYHPLMAEAFARFPSEEWVEVAPAGAASRCSRCARPRRRCTIRPCWPRAR